MLARYTIYRGKRPPGVDLPDGLRQDTRKHTRHILRPPADLVLAYLENPGERPWEDFREGYLRTLAKRFQTDRASFEKLTALARERDVFLGCSCPTKRNPDVHHCHTVLALQFMKDQFPELQVVMPE